MARVKFSDMIKQVFAATFNPVSFVALLGPIIMGINLLHLRLSVADESHLGLMIDDPVFRALMDYRTQLFTIIMAMIFYFFENVRRYYKFVRDHNVGELWNRIASDNWKMSNLVLGSFFCLIIFVTLLTGSYADPGIVNHYVRPPGPLSFDLMPPFWSPLTWLRVVIFIAGAVSSVAFSDLK